LAVTRNQSASVSFPFIMCKKAANLLNSKVAKFSCL
jgi:hypothetical protein